MRLSDLQNKDIVNVQDGKKIGNIVDIKINEQGDMEGMIVEQAKFLISMFSSRNEVEIKWNQIEKIGEDVILVNFGI